MFIGPNKRKGNMWDAVESKMLHDVCEDIPGQLEKKTTYYAAYCSDEKCEKLDKTVSTDGFVGAGESGSDMATIAKAATHQAKKVAERIEASKAAGGP